MTATKKRTGISNRFLKLSAGPATDLRCLDASVVFDKACGLILFRFISDILVLNIQNQTAAVRKTCAINGKNINF